MPEFIIRAHSAPVDPARFLASVGSGPHVEYLAQMIVNALFVSKGHRDDAVITLVCEDSKDYSRALTFDGARLGDLHGTHEAALLAACADALSAARGLGKEAQVTTATGIVVRTISFEHLVKEKTAAGQVLLLDRKGEDIRGTQLARDCVFLLTDHVPLPRKAAKSFTRLGAIPVSLGPVVLHGSQCITLIHNELDRRGSDPAGVGCGFANETANGE